MWNLVSSNPILDRRLKYKARMKHLQALDKMRGQIHITSPHKPKFLLTKQKSKQLDAEKKQSIHHSNDILIGKMMDVQASVPLHTTEVRRRPSSLSRSYRKKVEREIDLGNEMIIRKLQEIQSCYPVQQILRETDSYIYYKNNILNNKSHSCNGMSDVVKTANLHTVAF